MADDERHLDLAEIKERLEEIQKTDSLDVGLDVVF